MHDGWSGRRVAWYHLMGECDRINPLGASALCQLDSG